MEVFDFKMAPKHEISPDGPCCIVGHLGMPQCVKCLRCGLWINKWNADSECIPNKYSHESKYQGFIKE